MKKYLCFDVGGTKTKYGVLKENGEIEFFDSYYTEKNSKEKFLEKIINTIKKHKLENNIQGVSLCIPGIVDVYYGKVTLCYALRFLEKVNLKKILETECEIRVEVENDANCAALAEKFTGAAKECKDFVCMTIGTGIGGGIFANGSMIRGHKFLGGEFGFMIDGELDDLSKVELINNTASINGLIKMYKKLKNISNEVKITGEMVFDCGQVDEEVNCLIEQWYKKIAYIIFNLSGTLNPEKMLIGGGISNKEDFIENIEKHLNKIRYWKDIQVKIEPCYYKNKAGIIGALYNFLTIKREI